jgi:hypothetical protein
MERLGAALRGNLDEHLKKELREAESAVTQAIRTATTGLKNTMRAQVTAAGLGQKLANTWRGDVYPKGKKSINAAGRVYSKAEDIMEGFESGGAITGKDGFWLVIPTPNAPKKILGKRVTPGRLEKAWGIKLRFVYRRSGPSYLVAENMRASHNRKTGEFRSFRRASPTAIKSRKNLGSAIMFWVVPRVSIPKLIRFETEAAKWHRRIPQLIVQYWKEKK